MDKTPLEAWIEKWGTNLDWEAKDKLREAVEEMVLGEPERMTVEECSNCTTEVSIPAYRASLCPECGERILPCNECEEACNWMGETGCSRFPR
ncbi:hypothetical protein E4K67_17290 [Desulfosporosinus fructosivorans]|uniref:Uncharacterized protein n=1 Tax=Desulfosporosinus fructosivorans TaxID=2018669 RepID=A0A4Z0R2M2_9FIRM|nr:hypothetical protein [Desulfosporosinus fructosivorans]TGE36854.1 hypothetical protein E4K67_17290 [Desulfosporosinus fructosivorans]